MKREKFPNAFFTYPLTLKLATIVKLTMEGRGEGRGNEAGSALFPLKGALKSDILKID